MHRILLIDDDEALAPPLAQYLARFDFELVAVAKPSQGRVRLEQEPFDALILDGMLPEMDGFEFCRRLRAGDQAWAQMPVLMLSARGDLTDKVVGLEVGADDYLPKPFEPRELAARLQSLLRRAGQRGGTAPAGTPKLAGQRLFDGLRIDLDRRSVHTNGHDTPIELTSTEFALLALLASAPGKVFHRDEILSHLRGQDTEIFTRSVDILVSRLRKKLAPVDAVKTLRNAGYCLALPPLQPQAPQATPASTQP